MSRLEVQDFLTFFAVSIFKSISRDITGHLVAIKRGHPKANRDAMLQEAEIQAQFEHQFVVSLVGVVTIDEPLLVVLEFMEYGLMIFFRLSMICYSDKTAADGIVIDLNFIMFIRLDDQEP